MPTTSLLGRSADGAPAGIRPASPLRASRLFLLVVLTSQLMVVLDGTIVNVALPHIEGALHFSSTSLSWVLNAYTLTFGGLLLLGARTGDLLGRRRTFLIGITTVSLGYLAGGFATACLMLLAARALQGVGGAFAAPCALALLTTAFPEGAARVRAIGLFTAVSVAGGAIGLVAGGILTQWASWRWVMFVNVPIGATVWVLGRRVLSETHRSEGRFDALGAIFSTLGVGGIVLGLVEAGSRGWGDPLTVFSFAAGTLLLGAFVINEMRVESPILPLRLLAHPTRTAANIARGLLYAGSYGMFFFLTQFLQEVDHYSPVRAGLGFLPIPLSVFLSSQLTSRVLVNRLGTRPLVVMGIGASTLSFALLSRLHAGTPYALLLLELVLFGVGFGISLVSLTSASLAGVEARDAGAASGLINVMQQVGAALGVAVLVTVFGIATRHAGGPLLTPGSADATFVHGVDTAFRAGTVFLLAALATAALVIRPARPVEGTELEAAEIAEAA